MLAKAVALASKQAVKAGREPLPVKVTPHSLRRTFASLLFALGGTPPYVMAQMGHTTPNLTLSIYARQMDRRDREPVRLRALVEGGTPSAMQAQGAQRQLAKSAHEFLRRAGDEKLGQGIVLLAQRWEKLLDGGVRIPRSSDDAQRSLSGGRRLRSVSVTVTFDGFKEAGRCSAIFAEKVD